MALRHGRYLSLYRKQQDRFQAAAYDTMGLVGMYPESFLNWWTLLVGSNKSPAYAETTRLLTSSRCDRSYRVTSSSHCLANVINIYMNIQNLQSDLPSKSLISQVSCRYNVRVYEGPRHEKVHFLKISEANSYNLVVNGQWNFRGGL